MCQEEPVMFTEHAANRLFAYIKKRERHAKTSIFCASQFFEICYLSTKELVDNQLIL